MHIALNRDAHESLHDLHFIEMYHNNNIYIILSI